ncbi:MULTISPECIES: carbohydrate ABC transporter permease [Agrobacterium]|uniref:carbohydrate ABC transporter permease n=1 Tax=Agrobacterium TaxID=357 RepID=UPI0022B8399C|nr:MULTISPECIES: carbohydrate ABC transporter permease [Agrobacterium]MCZ7888004.1 carbohydrate ABC transporter permease [Agrobacterium salinitolerans]MDA5629375.1 carbohydrate ABC transporter permease [Agrobacterium sp. ST15.16.055]MDA6980837.1 carbohydrate ABC transporter permease [Agrobacterium salinitolerans]
MNGDIIEATRSIDRAANIVLAAGLIFILAPLVFTLITASQSYESFLRNGISPVPGTHLLENIQKLFATTRIPGQLANNFIVALAVASLKCLLAFLAAFGLVFFKVRYAPVIFAAVLSTLMLPLDLRIVTTYQIVSNIAMPVNALIDITGLNEAITAVFGRPVELKLNLLDTYAGMILPSLATGTGVFMMRQFFRTLPGDLVKAAQMDGAGWFRFMIDIALPLSRTTLIALFILMFLGGWTMYLWPLLASSTPDMQTAVVGLAKLTPDAGGEVPDYPLLMAGALVVSILPLLMIAFLQRFIVRGFTLTEK